MLSPFLVGYPEYANYLHLVEDTSELLATIDLTPELPPQSVTQAYVLWLFFGAEFPSVACTLWGEPDDGKQNANEGQQGGRLLDRAEYEVTHQKHSPSVNMLIAVETYISIALSGQWPVRL